MKKRVKKIILETGQVLLDKQIEHIALETIREKKLGPKIDFVPEDQNENIFSSILSLQMLVNCKNCGQDRLEIENNISLTQKKIISIHSKKIN
jgi:hypothetical protein